MAENNSLFQQKHRQRNDFSIFLPALPLARRLRVISWGALGACSGSFLLEWLELAGGEAGLDEDMFVLVWGFWLGTVVASLPFLDSSYHNTTTTISIFIGWCLSSSAPCNEKKTLFFSRIPFVSLLLRFLICCRRTTTVVSSIHPCSVVLKRVRVNLMSMRRRKLTEFAEHCSQKDMHT